MKTKAVIGFLILLAIPLKAQDRQFWDQAVGGRTALLGGIAVGGVRDYSATFYNPGALGFISKKSMNFSLNMYGVKDFSFLGGGGPNIDSRYTRVSLYPASLAGPLPFLGDSLSRYSYMISSTGYSYVRISERYEGYADVIPTRPPWQPGGPPAFMGNEYLINQGKIDVLLSEVTVGFGYSQKISHNVGLGVSILGAYRDQTKTRVESYTAFDSINQRSANSNLFVDIDYWAVRFSAKFGIAAEWEKLKLGVTVTTPSLAIKFASGGTDGASVTSNNVLVLTDTTTHQVTPVDVVASDRQEGLPVHYKSPFSMAAGIEYMISEETSVHLAMEWFAPVSTYAVMQPASESFVLNSPTTFKPFDSADLLKVYDSMKSVFNVGLAVEHKMNDKITGYAAIRSDFSNANYEDIHGLSLGITDFNIYHFTLGGSMKADETLISVGFEYSHGQRPDFSRIFNFPSGAVEPNQAVVSDRGTCNALYNNFNLFFSVTKLF
jgi:hypothetical protein